MKIKGKILVLLVCVITSGCGTYFNQPTAVAPSRMGEVTTYTKTLKDFPLPKEPVVVGVYNFKDQTGQYKSVEAGSTFSTAIPQGATTILIKALEDSKWFTPIERENLGNLLNERNIIRSTRDEHRKSNAKDVPSLTPLLFAGILLEGGVVSYDTNIITGGAGARYFGAGGSTQYRQDRLTVYLRAVSTSNGKILKTVYVSKTILSQSIDASLFRYVSFQRILEAETGITRNEPVQLALKDAIEKAVEGMIIEGIDDGLWGTAKGKRMDDYLVNEYLKEKQIDESKLLYDRKQKPIVHRDALQFTVASPLLNADFSKKSLGIGGGIGFSKSITPKLNANFSVGYLYFTGGNGFFKEYMNADLNLEYKILPYDTVGPFLYGGAGAAFDLHSTPVELKEKSSAPKVQFGVGVDVYLTQRFDLRLFAENNIVFSDAIDDLINGKRDDFYYNFGVSLKYKLGKGYK